ncbi:YceI family protein [Tenacibaculum sp. IB213877]|uniref:YceI family protein n=1 Tax=Tenacibaculum sp. IB213877 TaxID=3097351 RepID=UPI002A5A4637|nr:YceI family protein [Tenacibaculum sp. IB213877]MDY0779831.1 YceI family protein [Tenacibaculum sp. IB213877]
MKSTIKILILLLITFAIFSFTSRVIKEKEVKIKSSTISWKGYKVAGSHTGIIQLKSGVLKFDNNMLVGGEFEIDMSSIVCTDLSGEYKEKLEGHLKSDDFFGTEKHPTATLVYTNVQKKENNTYSVTANLTIKNKVHPVSFDMVVSKNNATASLKVDRTKYDIKYGSSSFFDNLKDKAIHDEFDVTVALQF